MWIVFNAGMSGTASEWGRIDADGTVYVRTAEGERAIGSWQAGDAEAGLAYYTRKYDDLATEVALLQRRLESGAGDPAATKTSAVELRDSLPAAAVIGDLQTLDARLEQIITAADEKAGERAAARQQARAEAVAAKEALVAEAEQLAAESTSWKSAGDRLRAIVDEW
jgi:FtsZ-binding cell division protein ZapB